MVEEKVRDRVGTLKEPFHTLISAAILAPSGDNTQPWRFEIDEAASAITICVDKERDLSPMNAGQHMSHVACGATLENIERTSLRNGWDAKTVLHVSEKVLATVYISGDFSTTGTL